MIKEAEQEYNDLRQFASKFDYPTGKCKNIIQLFQELNNLIDKLVYFNEEKITSDQLSKELIDKFKSDLEVYYNLRVKGTHQEGKDSHSLPSKIVLELSEDEAALAKFRRVDDLQFKIVLTVNREHFVDILSSLVERKI